MIGIKKLAGRLSFFDLFVELRKCEELVSDQRIVLAARVHAGLSTNRKFCSLMIQQRWSAAHNDHMLDCKTHTGWRGWGGVFS